MTNESELLLNTVMNDKPKMLTGLNQKGLSRKATSSHAKAGRLPLGLSLRESLSNLLQEGIADDYARNCLRGCALTRIGQLAQHRLGQVSP
ncbi:hypothetical protein IPC1370_30720 [Pseudomonas aeruginosa]|nr:hypothetical protein IPC1370_30720 [Pseudomonas aeruginosa]